ncbi:hypothetical protein BU16DRAFT_562372 [Lophium mytilinum]|uniref:Uncharacterized protein n=1 Tax=Lophium mytilinum TaxID=390894 RepID=A0A6A6QQH5_9PEZI|nr:hypothetical protein BU16DRAFT_562372 [Lophium mytilinum]
MPRGCQRAHDRLSTFPIVPMSALSDSIKPSDQATKASPLPTKNMDSSTLYSIFLAHFKEEGFESDGFGQDALTTDITLTPPLEFASTSKVMLTPIPQYSTSVGVDATPLPAAGCPEGAIRLSFSAKQLETKIAIKENGIAIIMDNEWIERFQEAALKDKATLGSHSRDGKSVQSELAKVLWTFTRTLYEDSEDVHIQVGRESKDSDEEGWTQVEDVDEVLLVEDFDVDL